MNTCRWIKDVEACFDGESRAPDKVQAHVNECAVCGGHWERLNALRTGVRTLPEAPGIADAQFGAFMDGVRQGCEAPVRRPQGIMAMISLVAAALLISMAALVIFRPGPKPIRATVESMSTELEGYGVESRDMGDTTTIWITPLKDDI